MEKHAQNNHSFAPGHWMPHDQKTLVEWMKKIMDKADKCDKPLLPVVENLKHFIENDAKAYMFFNQMFDEVPSSKRKTPFAIRTILIQSKHNKHKIELV